MWSPPVILIWVIILDHVCGQPRPPTIKFRCQLRCPRNRVCRLYPQWCRKPPCVRKPTCIYPRKKPGLCPAFIVPFPGMFESRCYLDYDCPDKMVCCGPQQNRWCVKTYKYSGQCPRSEPAATCDYPCTDDFDCRRGSTCCYFKNCRRKVCTWPQSLDWFDLKNYRSQFAAPTEEI